MGRAASHGFTAPLLRSLVLMCAALAATLGISLAHAAGPDAAAPDLGARTRVLALVNQERADRGLSPLAENPTLDSAAQAYADVLTSDACFGHTCGPQPDFRARNADAGYNPWLWLGENLAAGQSTPDELVGAWMSSPLHRENVLRPEFTELGVGIAHGGAHGTYWTAEFGARPLDALVSDA